MTPEELLAHLASLTSEEVIEFWSKTRALADKEFSLLPKYRILENPLYPLLQSTFEAADRGQSSMQRYAARQNPQPRKLT